jgi:hypothetical protein
MKQIRQLFLGGIIFLSAVKAKAQIPNHSFEQWQTRNFGAVQYEELTNWLSNNSYFASINQGKLPVKKTTDAHSGTYAVEMTNVPDTGRIKKSGNIYTGIVNSLTQEDNLKFKLSSKPKSFEAYYKYFPVNNDKFKITIYITKNGEVVGFGTYSGLAANNYTKLSTAIEYTDETIIPDSAAIFINASELEAYEGTRLIIDDLSFTDATASVSKVKNTDLSILVYPNPAQDKLFFNLNNQSALVAIIDLNGKILLQNEVSKTNNYIDLLGIKNGIYLAQVTTEQGVVNHKIVVNK